MRDGVAWLGLEAADDGWRLPVTSALVSGAGALFGGAGTAAAVVVAQAVAPQPVRFAAVHFGALAQRDTVVDLRTRTISTGRTMTHLEVVGSVDERESFTARIAAGDRPAHPSGGQWVSPPSVPAVDGCEPFDHPVHADSWAARFDWRLAGSGEAWAAWWVHPLEPCDPLVTAAVLTDYVTYGVGRALDAPMGGLSVDNVLRVHRLVDAAWFLLEVRPTAIEGGFGHGVGRLFTDDGVLVAEGSQTIVVNGWDWRT